MENYRHNFTIDLKTSIKNILKKYFNQNDRLYPVDLFEVVSRQQAEKILEYEFPENRIIESVNSNNRKIKNSLVQQLDELNTQIEGLEKEKQQTDKNQVQQINLIDNVINRLQTSKNGLETKIQSSIINKQKKVDSAAVSVYMHAASLIADNIPDRNIDLIDFYKYGFGKIGHSKELFLAIWKSYFDKSLMSVPSMIFPLCNEILYRIVVLFRNGNLDEPTKQDLSVIINFYDIVRKYIDSKTTYPDNLDDNPILREETHHIVYLINLIITPAVKNILLNQIITGLKEMDVSNTVILDVGKVLDEILSTEYNGQTMDSYLTNILPGLAIKYYTTIYNNKVDTDKQINDYIELFIPILQIVKSNKIVQLTDDSLLIKNLREYLFPFLDNTYRNFINYLRLAIYGYERYILNTCQYGKILQILVSKNF